jgi:hypothetical protein
MAPLFSKETAFAVLLSAGFFKLLPLRQRNFFFAGFPTVH